MERYTTDKGTTIEADLTFVTFGVTLNTDSLKADFSTHLDHMGRVKVNQYLQLEGYPNIFAIGDITNIPEPKLSSAAKVHGGIVAENIQILAASNGALKSHTPITIPLVVVPVGSSLGAMQLPLGKNSLVLGAWAASRGKGKQLLVKRYWKALNNVMPFKA